jgi:DNA (cytosine-5)-methyltransferase 1
MLTPQFLLPISSELVIDLFAGGGGASTGIEKAIGRPVDIAINHNADAISIHAANHPQTKHYCSDIFEVDPLEATKGRKVGLLWASPDCKHFSKAKGGKPRDGKIRSLAWVVVKWASKARPRVIYLENVEEFSTWGPLGKDSTPLIEHKGETFDLWVQALRNLGYVVEWKILKACDFGAPTIRKRLFLIARCDGEQIVWPSPTHEDKKKNKASFGVSKKLKPYRSAASCIDFTLPAPSIFDRAKPLADATMARIAKGLKKFVIDSPSPFIVSLAHGEVSTGGVKRWGSGVRSIDDPLQTVLASGNGAAICVPTMVQVGYGERDGQAPRSLDIEQPLGTVVAGSCKHALVMAFLAKHYGGADGSDLNTPLGTVTSIDHHSLVSVFLTEHANASNQRNFDATEPLRTQCAQVKGGHFAAVSAFLVKYYGTAEHGACIGNPLCTVTTKDRCGLVLVHLNGDPYVIVDIGMRMLQPSELFLAQGFASNYIIDVGADGRRLSKAAQVRLCGNSVSPNVSEAIVAANYSENSLILAAA